LDFVLYISTPKNTPKADPLITSLKLTKGRLTGGFLFFPSGPAGKLHFIARMGRHQILPFNTDQCYSLDDCVVNFGLGIKLAEPPFIVDCVTWNESTEYPHVLTVSFSLEPDREKQYDIESLISKLQNG